MNNNLYRISDFDRKLHNQRKRIKIPGTNAFISDEIAEKAIH